MITPYRLTKLRNGVRIASAEMPHMRSVAVGFWAGVGGRFETAENNGISHFVEHLLFKGTRKRSARQITEAVEGVGGYLNAFTTEDHTCYYAKAGAPHLGTLCEVLGDMYLNSEFSPTEIEREREVIREEILMYKDHPAQHAQELLEETMWPGHPLGRPLTGTVESIAKLNRKQLLRFVRENYNARTTIITVAGRASHEEVLAAVQPIARKLEPGLPPRYLRARVDEGEPRISLVTQEIEQTHLAMGFHAYGRRDERRFALKLLSVILGENMSSRLFQQLRERHGFCYSIQTGMATLADGGSLSIYAGLDAGKLEKAIGVILRELARICRKAPDKKELRKAQDYTIGQNFMGLESTTNQIMWVGESILGYRKIIDPGEAEQRLLAVTPEEVRAVACDCLRLARSGTAVVGPIKDAAAIRRVLGNGS